VHVPLVEVTTVPEALGALREYGEDAKIVAGGTAVTIMLRQRLIDPTALVSIRGIPDLDHIVVEDGALRIGALVSLGQVARSRVVAEVAPILCRAFGVVGNVRVQAAATVGGVLAEADYASDPPCALLALDAEVAIEGPLRGRVVPLSEFVLGFYETVLDPDEMVVELRVPVPPSGLNAVYEKFRTRSSEDRPCVGVLAAVELASDGSCRQVRLAVGAAGEKAERFRELESEAVGGVLDGTLAQHIADGYAERIDTLDDMRGSAAYRRHLIRVWGRRALLHAAGAPPS
jgi:aerobic carbon-monoxide dehydrogenase medium subunit